MSCGMPKQPLVHHLKLLAFGESPNKKLDHQRRIFGSAKNGAFTRAGHFKMVIEIIITHGMELNLSR